jgi:hypothetical protein
MQQKRLSSSGPRIWGSGHSSPLERQPRELPNAGRTWVNHHERGVALKVFGYLGWAVNDSKPRPLYKPVTGERQDAATRFFKAGIRW